MLQSTASDKWSRWFRALADSGHCSGVVLFTPFAYMCGLIFWKPEHMLSRSAVPLHFRSEIGETKESGSPELRVCISIMQEPMLGHLTVLRSPVPSASGSLERRGSTDPDPKSVTRESGCPQLRVCISITSIICGKCLSPIDPRL